MIPVKHGQEEVSHSLCLVFLDVVLLVEHRLQRPVVEALDAFQVAAVGEELAAVFAGESEVLWHSSEKLHHLRQVVIILVVVVALARLEQEFAGDHLKDSARERPDIS